MADEWQQFRDDIADALTDAYCGGASGRGWVFVGDPIPKDEVKARLVQDPDKTRHIAHMEKAVWGVIERWCEPPPNPSPASRETRLTTEETP